MYERFAKDGWTNLNSLCIQRNSPSRNRQSYHAWLVYSATVEAYHIRPKTHQTAKTRKTFQKLQNLRSCQSPKDSAEASKDQKIRKALSKLTKSPKSRQPCVADKIQKLPTSASPLENTRVSVLALPNPPSPIRWAPAKNFALFNMLQPYCIASPADATDSNATDVNIIDTFPASPRRLARSWSESSRSLCRIRCAGHRSPESRRQGSSLR